MLTVEDVGWMRHQGFSEEEAYRLLDVAERAIKLRCALEGVAVLPYIPEVYQLYDALDALEAAREQN